MNTLKAIIFDVDGTLAETERDGHRPAFNAAFRDCGLAWHWDEQRYGELLAITGGKERIRHYAAQYDPDIAARPDFDALVGQLHKIKTAHYLRLVDQGQLPLRPGVARLIADARQAGIRLAIATTTTPENVDALLRANLGPDAPRLVRSHRRRRHRPGQKAGPRHLPMGPQPPRPAGNRLPGHRRFGNGPEIRIDRRLVLPGHDQRIHPRAGFSRGGEGA